MSLKAKSADILLLTISTAVTLTVALLLIRWFAPTLLGLPADMVLLRSSNETPPYYENIFRKEHWESTEFIMNDPLVRVRAKPFYPDIGGIGPNDLLGFRNLSIPNSADAIIIGDSQTYGNNASIYQNFPHLLQDKLSPGTSVYSMATGGWAALQYYYAFAKSGVFTPKVVVVAFYSGNDPLETFMLAAASEVWREFLPGPKQSWDEDLSVKPPAFVESQWPVTFSDGIKTVFTPKVRHNSNMSHRAVDVGYKIMLYVAQKISEKANKDGIKLIFTIIPTKEYAYSDKVDDEALTPPVDYAALIVDEARRISEFSALLKQLPGAHYVDTAGALKSAAMAAVNLYPEDTNGHPVASGYEVIAAALTDTVSKLLSVPEDGLVARVSANGSQLPVYINKGQYWIVEGEFAEIHALFQESSQRVVATRELSGFKYMGYIDVNILSEKLGYISE